MTCPKCNEEIQPIAWWSEDGYAGWLCELCREEIDSDLVETEENDDLVQRLNEQFGGQTQPPRNVPGLPQDTTPFILNLKELKYIIEDLQGAVNSLLKEREQLNTKVQKLESRIDFYIFKEEMNNAQQRSSL